MDIEQMKRNNLDDPQNIKYFANQIMNNSFKFGPAGVSNLLTEAFLSSDESFSAQAWFSVLSFLSRYNAENAKGGFYEESFTSNERVKSYTRLIQKVFELFHNKELIIPFYINHGKWSRKIINELTPSYKAIIYSMDIYFSNKLKTFGYKSIKPLLLDESVKVRVMTESYCSFMEEVSK